MSLWTKAGMLLMVGGRICLNEECPCPPVLCGVCIGIPDRLEVEISGVIDRGCGGDFCADINGTYILTKMDVPDFCYYTFSDVDNPGSTLTILVEIIRFTGDITVYLNLQIYGNCGSGSFSIGTARAISNFTTCKEIEEEITSVLTFSGGCQFYFSTVRVKAI